MKLVIIAGGKGTRLGMNDIPKPMISIGGKPLLEHQIILAKRYGIREIYILSGYLSDVIVKYFGDGRDFGVQITHVVEQQSLGTAGAVKQLESSISDRFLIFYGDILMDFDIAKFIEFDALAPAAATIIVHPNDHPYDSDLVEVNGEDIVTAFHSKLRDTSRFYRNLVNAAVYIIGPEIFRYIPEDKPTDFGRDIFPLLLKSGEIIRAYNTAEYVKDIGTPERFRLANDHFTSGRVERMSKRHKRPAIFLDRDGTLVKDVHLLHQQEQLELYPFSGRAVKNVNDSDYLCLLITNQPVVARNLCDESGLREIHNKLETLLAEEGAYLDDIYFCPHHPDTGFPGENPAFKIDCDCRKPKTGMVDRAVQEFNLDIVSSWLIGDTTTDLQTGRNAGMQTILLRTGKGGKDGKFDCAADFIFDHLDEATDFIIGHRYAYDAYAAHVLERLNIGNKQSPCVIIVAGLARSGKSTFVQVLRSAMSKHNILSQVVSLDNWLIGVKQRSTNMTVRERYKYHEIESDIRALLNGETIAQKIYDPYSRAILSEKPLSCAASSCLIIDGVPALDIDYLRNISKVKVYVDIDETVRKDRFFSFYRWKDLPEDDINNLYQQRLHDEAPYVLESKKYADLVVEVK